MKKSLNSLARFSIVVLLVSCLLSVSAFAADISSTVYDDEEYRKITEVCAAFPVRSDRPHLRNVLYCGRGPGDLK